MTVRGIGVQDSARRLAASCSTTTRGLYPDVKTSILKRQLTSDLFISGSNAVTLEGELVNVDGTGNRVAALNFGPTKTIVVVGVNKIVRDLDEAFARIESWAAPMNNKRLDKPNPCVKAGVCMDCDGDTRICRVYQILRKRPSGTDFTVIVVGEELSSDRFPEPASAAGSPTLIQQPAGGCIGDQAPVGAQFQDRYIVIPPPIVPEQQSLVQRIADAVHFEGDVGGE